MIWLVLALAALAPPTYLVERVTASEQGVVRVTVFRDRMAVLARRAGQGEPQITAVRLEELEYAVVAQVVEECYGELKRQPALRDALEVGKTEFRLAPPNKEPLVVVVSHTAVRTLAAARLERALDELQRRIEQTPAGAEDLSSWDPVLGERVVLMDGREGRVAALLPSSEGVLVQLDIGPVSQFMTVPELRRRAVRRLAP
jgi:hypothetical protein